MVKIFNHYFHKRTLLQIFFDFGLVVATMVIAAMSQVTNTALVWSQMVTQLLILAFGVVVINAGLGFYQRSHSCTQRQSRARAALSLSLSVPLAYAIYHWSPFPLESQGVMLVTLMAVMGIMLANRVYATHVSTRTRLRQRVLVYGSGERAKLVGRMLTQSDPNVDLVGYYASPNEGTDNLAEGSLLSSKKSLTDIVLDERVDEIVVALSERRGGSMPLRELLDCKLHGVRVVDIATHFEKTLGQIRRDSVSAGWLIFGDGFEQGWMRTLVKRVFDIVCASLLLMFAAPVMVGTALLIFLESGGPVLYRQERVGLNGRLFNVIKFRSMRTDAEKDGQPRWAAAADDRVTGVGRVILKLRIDELPQLFSVLWGDMSLVGPRPERPYFVDKLTHELAFYAVRQSVKPGVTGWAQVRYHYGASVEDSAEKLQYDLYYVKNHSLFLDLLVLFETVGVVLMAKGAH